MKPGATATAIRPRRYFDSVLLMRVAQRLAAEPGVLDAAAVMGTEANKTLLRDAGFAGPEIEGAASDDLVVCIRTDGTAGAARVLERLDDVLLAPGVERQASLPRSVGDALALDPGANLAVISLPGEYAAREARAALEHGLHVFLFSSGVSVEDEVELKRAGREQGLLVMGPDCGTAIIGGAGLGFANAVRRGPIAVVGPSGTGIQAVTTLVHRLGSGISHAIGTGSRDLSDVVGGISTLVALKALQRDPATKVIVVVAKPPGREALNDLLAAIDAFQTPVVTCFLGSEVGTVRTLDEAARAAVSRLGLGTLDDDQAAHLDAVVEAERGARGPGQRFIRGLFAGGSLCAEAQSVLLDAGLRVASNAPIRPELRLDDTARSDGHTVLDMGTEEFTTGRPHPMIDPRARRERILSESGDGDVAVLLLDFVLGYGAAEDPAGDLADAIATARKTVAERGGLLSVVASVIGTEDDPQGLAAQEKTLREAGAIVVGSSAAAARLAARLAEVRP